MPLTISVLVCPAALRAGAPNTTYRDVPLRTALPDGSSTTARSISVALRLAPGEVAAVEGADVQPGGSSFCSASGFTLKARMVRVSLLHSVMFCAAATEGMTR